MPYYEYDHTYDYRPTRPYSPRSSSLSLYHLQDPCVTLPSSIIWSTMYPAKAHRTTPSFMDPSSSDRETMQPGKSRKRLEKRDHVLTHPEGGGGERRRNTIHRSKQIDKAITVARHSLLDVNPQLAFRIRERRLVEIRLLLSQLHAQLQTAYNLYRTLDDKFKKHYHNVKGFANADTLDRIWADLLRSEMTQGEAQAQRPANFDSVIAQVNLCLRHLQSVEFDTLPSVEGFHESNTLIERHVKNVVKAVEGVEEIAARAHIDRLACEGLVWHLNRAWNSTNPESVVWKGLLGRLPAADKAYLALDDD